MNIPVDELRGRLDELPRDRRLVVYCGVGLRAYIACRLLSQHGSRAANVPGGYLTYQHYRPQLPG
jgi:rhodanese-related sulfurtransferase